MIIIHIGDHNNGCLDCAALCECDQCTELIENVIDTAGYGIGYWATSAEHDSKAKTYTVVDSEKEDEPKILTYQQIHKAMKDLATAHNSIRREIRMNLLLSVLQPEEADIDASDADCVIQWAMFGEIIYG
jgi:hypothetical protein